MTGHEKALRLTRAISEYIIRNVPYIAYTDMDVYKAEKGYSAEEKQILREAGWLSDDFECFYVINRFVQALGLDEQADDLYLKNMYENARRLDRDNFYRDPYLTNITVPQVRTGRFQLRQVTYSRGEILQYAMPDLRAAVPVPRLGFFTEEVSFPCVYEGSMPWVSVCPSEINSMQPDTEKAFGDTLVLGLGLGYYPYIISSLDRVRSVTVIELQQEIIDLFEKHILPQFGCRDKIRIIRADAFDYLETVRPGDYDFCYADIWESQVDGAEAYTKIHPHEKRLPGTRFEYWIRDQILWQLEQYRE